MLRRILNVTEATPEQQAQIRELWHAHEDGRRTLQAAAPPRQSGPPVLDLRKLQELDFRFESSVVAGVLQPQQRDRLVAEIYPQQK